MTMNFLPLLGGGRRAGNVWHACGYNGHGVAQAAAAGEMLADCIHGKSAEWLATLPGGALPVPPEPLPWVAVNGLLALFHSLDRVTDARVRRGMKK